MTPARPRYSRTSPDPSSTSGGWGPRPSSMPGPAGLPGQRRGGPPVPRRVRRGRPRREVVFTLGGTSRPPHPRRLHRGGDHPHPRRRQDPGPPRAPGRSPTTPWRPRGRAGTTTSAGWPWRRPAATPAPGAGPRGAEPPDRACPGRPDRPVQLWLEDGVRMLDCQLFGGELQGSMVATFCSSWPQAARPDQGGGHPGVADVHASAIWAMVWPRPWATSLRARTLSRICSSSWLGRACPAGWPATLRAPPPGSGR